MGKYGFESGSDDDELKSIQIKFLVRIANELAEANRLQRIFIGYRVLQEGVAPSGLKELEDQA